MPFFEVDVAVMVQRKIRLEALGMDAAQEIACELVEKQTIADMEKGLVAHAAPPLLLNTSLIEAVEVAGGLTLDAYTCDGCGEASIKTEWGPGWLTCPRCKAVKGKGNR